MRTIRRNYLRTMNRTRFPLVPLGLLLSASAACAMTFSDWQWDHFDDGEMEVPQICGEAADADADGFSNLLEYAFGQDPHVADTAGVALDPGPEAPAISYPESIAATDVVYRLEESSDLALWHWITPNASTRQILSDDGTTRRVSLPLLAGAGKSGKWFARIRVTLPAGNPAGLLPPSSLTGAAGIPIALRWNDNSGIEQGFAIERREGEEWLEISTTPEDINAFTDWDVVGSTAYSYRVRAFNEEAGTIPSNEITLISPPDTDHDGLPDDQEAAYGTDPLVYSTAGTGIPDGWWVRYGLSPFTDEFSDTDGDGRSDREEFFDGTAPTDLFNGLAPVIAIVSGNEQTGSPGGLLSTALVVAVSGSWGPLANATVTFSVTSGGGSLQASSSASPANSINVRTDSTGEARAFFTLPDAWYASCQITAACGTPAAQTVFSAASDDGSTPRISPFAPSDLTVAYHDDGSMDVAWTNTADDGEPIPVSMRMPDGSWQEIATLTAPANTIHIPAE